MVVYVVVLRPQLHGGRMALKSSRVDELVTLIGSWSQFWIVRGKKDILNTSVFGVDLPQSVCPSGSVVTFVDDTVGFWYGNHAIDGLEHDQ